MTHTNPRIHLAAALLFTVMTITAALIVRNSQDPRWRLFSVLIFAAAILAWLFYARSHHLAAVARHDCSQVYPEGQARLIDSGRLPNRINPRLDLKDYEICHFYTEARRVFFQQLPDKWRVEPERLLLRLSGGCYYYIIRPEEILLMADLDDSTEGELVITNQRIIFLASENGFEAPLRNIKMLDCSARLVDFQVRGRRYTIQTEAACYAEKVLALLAGNQNH